MQHTMIICIWKHFKELCLSWVFIFATLSVSTFGDEMRDICSKPTGVIERDSSCNELWSFERKNCSNDEDTLFLYLVRHKYTNHYTSIDGRVCYYDISYKKPGEQETGRLCFEKINDHIVWATKSFPFQLNMSLSSAFTLFYTTISESSLDVTVPIRPTPIGLRSTTGESMEGPNFTHTSVSSGFTSTIEASTIDESEESSGDEARDLCSKPIGVVRHEGEGVEEWIFERKNCNSYAAVLIFYLVPSYMIYHPQKDGRRCYNELSYSDEYYFTTFCMQKSDQNFRLLATGSFPVYLKYSSESYRSFTLYYATIDKAAAFGGINNFYSNDYFDNLVPNATEIYAEDEKTTKSQNVTVYTLPSDDSEFMPVERILAIALGILLLIMLILLVASVLRNRNLKRILTERRGLINIESNIAHQDCTSGNNVACEAKDKEE